MVWEAAVRRYRIPISEQPRFDGCSQHLLKEAQELLEQPDLLPWSLRKTQPEKWVQSDRLETTTGIHLHLGIRLNQI